MKREKKTKKVARFSHRDRKNPPRAINNTCERMSEPTNTDRLFIRGSCPTREAIRGGVMNLENPPQKRRRPTIVLDPPNCFMYVGTKMGAMMSCQPVVPKRP